MKFIA